MVFRYPDALIIEQAGGGERTPLNLACYFGHSYEPAVVQLLATPEAAKITDIYGMMLPLHGFC